MKNKLFSHVLRRLGSVPFWRGETRCLPAMDQMYERAAVFAAGRLSANKKENEDATRN